jgi:hypothetical protein
MRSIFMSSVVLALALGCSESHQRADAPDAAPTAPDAAPSAACPIDPAAWVGTACREEGLLCGEPCTRTPVVGCSDGEWQFFDDICDACPADPLSAIGGRCSVDGRTCESSECGPGVVCEDGEWQALAYHCAERAFDCGPDLTCTAGAEYCLVQPNDAAPGPADYFHCRPLPVGCSGCECFPELEGSRRCTEHDDGAVVVRGEGG